jgi:DNA-binding CsgD family transcriptional regulator
VARLVQREVVRLGFDHYMYWLRFAPNGQRVRYYFGNYPKHWADRYADEEYEADDVVMHAINGALTPFVWGDPAVAARATPAQRIVIHEAMEAGLTSGVAVPVNGPGAARAHLIIATTMGAAELHRLYAEHRHELYLIGLYTHERALALAGGPEGGLQARLTPREHEILKWVVRGKTNWEIGGILSVAETTVKEHVRNICEKFGVRTKMHAATIAVWRGYTAL